MYIPFIDLRGQTLQLKVQIQEVIGRVLDRADFILGQEVCQFEEAFARYCRVRYAVCVSSGTMALYLALPSL